MPAGERSTAQEAGDNANATVSAPPSREAKPSRFTASDLPPLTPGIGVRKMEKLDGRLEKLARVDAVARATGSALAELPASSLPDDLRADIASSTLLLDDDGRVQVFATVGGDYEIAAQELTALGMTIDQTNDDRSLIQGRLPLGALTAAAAVASVAAIHPPERATIYAGAVTSEGDAILDANDLRSVLGVTGAGVRIGVLSDGLTGLATAQASGDLPPVVNSASCNVVATSPISPTAGAEGTALLEIIHDVAPGAELWFGHFGATSGGTSLDFIDAVDCLALNTDIVIDDVGFLGNGAYDGTSPVSQNATTELNRATNRIRGYYNAAGNHATSHYQEPYFKSGPDVDDGMGNVWGIHGFRATSSTSDNGFGLFCLAGGTPCQADEVFLPPGGTLSVIMQWNDPFTNSSNDYDLLLFDGFDGSLSLASGAIQSGPGSSPVEGFSIVNPHGVSTSFGLVIGNFQNAAATRTFDMFVQCFPCSIYPDGATHNYNTPASSVANNSDAGGGVFSLGAINAVDAGHDTIEPYSSRGPTNDGRQKPDATAIDGVSVSGAGAFPSPFFGTSAAAPHAAAISALLLSCRPSLKSGGSGDNPAADRSALRSALVNSSVDLGTSGADFVFGAGRLDADAAALAAGCTPPTATATRTVTPTPTQTFAPTPTATATSVPETDTDADGVPDSTDNCASVANPTQLNTDRAAIIIPGVAPIDTTIANNDALGDACDPDDDNDGLGDDAEAGGCNGSGALDAVLFDTDGDRTGDAAECALGSDPSNALSKPRRPMPGDTDHDGLPDALETTIGSNPNVVDTDGDGIHDGFEYKGYNTSPTVMDTDGDGCNDDTEITDVTGSRKTDVVDLFLVAQSMDHTARPNHDITKDGAINVVDLFLVAANTTDTVCPAQ